MRILFPSLRIPFVTISLARSRASMIAASFPLSLLGQPSNSHADHVYTLHHPLHFARSRSC